MSQKNHFLVPKEHFSEQFLKEPSEECFNNLNNILPL